MQWFGPTRGGMVQNMFGPYEGRGKIAEKREKTEERREQREERREKRETRR